MKKGEDVIIARKITKEYRSYKKNSDKLAEMGRKREVLKDVDFKIKKSEVIGVIGKNGSGKSTLLRIISGITYPTSGKIIVKEEICLMALGVGFMPELSGHQNIFIKLSLLGIPKFRAKSIVKEIVQFAELEKDIHKPMKHYSSGMRARLGFAITVFSNPKILIVDEALTVGDFAFKKKSFSKIKELNENGTTIIYVSHAVDSLMNFCDRVIWLENGKMLTIAQTALVLNLYKKKLRAERQQIKGVPDQVTCNTDTELELSELIKLNKSRFSHERKYSVGTPVTISINYQVEMEIEDELFYRIEVNNANNELVYSYREKQINLPTEIGEHNLSLNVKTDNFKIGEYFIYVIFEDIKQKNQTPILYKRKIEVIESQVEEVKVLERIYNDEFGSLTREEKTMVQLFIDNDPLIKTGYEKNGRIYGYPFLQSQLNLSEKAFDITSEVQCYPIIENVTKTSTSIIISGFMWSDILSFDQKNNLKYNFYENDQIMKNVKIKIHQRPDLNRLSTGIIYFYYSGFTIEIPKKSLSVGDYSLEINRGLYEKQMMLFTISLMDKKQVLAMNYLQNQKMKHLLKLIVFQFENDEIRFFNSTKYYQKFFEENLVIQCLEKRTKRLLHSFKIDSWLSVAELREMTANDILFSFKFMNEDVEIGYENILSDPKEMNSQLSFIPSIGIILKATKSLRNDGRILNNIKKMIKQPLPSRKLFENVEGVRERILSFEKNAHLEVLKIYGVHVWQISRFMQFNNIYSEMKVFDSIFQGKKNVEQKLTRNEFSLAYEGSDFLNSPFNSPLKKEIIFDNLRKIERNGEYVDTSSYSYIKAKDEYNYLVCEEAMFFEHKIGTGNTRKYLDGYQRFSRLHSPIGHFKIIFKDNEYVFVQQVSQEHENQFGYKKNYEQTFRNWIRRYIYEYTYNYHIMRALQPQQITVVGPYKPWLFSAAKHLGIYRKELQYAAIESAHPAYEYTIQSDYKADTIVLWGDAWKSEVNHRLYQVQYMKNAFAIEGIEEIKMTTKRMQYDYLYLSQGTIGGEMIKFMYNHWKQYPEDTILYRLHPHETIEQYPLLQKMVAKDLVKVVTFNDESIYQSIGTAKNIIGVYSTGLMEAYAAGKSVILLNLSGAFYLEKFRRENNIPFITNVDDLKENYSNPVNKLNLFNGGTRE